MLPGSRWLAPVANVVTLEYLKTVIISRFPEFSHASFTLLTTGWDSVAVDVTNRLIFKFPPGKETADALQREASMLQLICSRVSLPVPDLVIFETPEVFSRHAKLHGNHLVATQYEALPPIIKQKLGIAAERDRAAERIICHLKEKTGSQT